MNLQDSNEINTVPSELAEEANNIALNLLPEKSKQIYTKAYNNFKKWQISKKSNSFAEEMFLVYFNELSKTVSPSTLWSYYSMLKSTVSSYNNIEINKYKKLIAFLKKVNKSYVPKKSKVFTAEDLSNYCNKAPDNEYLVNKVNIQDKKIFFIKLIFFILKIIYNCFR